MLTLHGVAYTHPNKDLLFQDIDLSLGRQQKAALIGNNGAGKSTLLRLMAGELAPSSGSIRREGAACYVPQHFGQFDAQPVAAALGIAAKWTALRALLAGDTGEVHFTTLDDDWTLEERTRAALAHWGLSGLSPDAPMGALSGGQKTRVFLAGVALQQPGLLLLDEPSNHLDREGRRLLPGLLQSFAGALVLVSHDRALLNSLDTMLELGPRGLLAYGGNYDFYAGQKEVARAALEDELKDHEKALRKAKETARDAIARQQKLDARGKKKQEKAGLPTISMNTLRNHAERSTARMKEVHAGKTEGLARDVEALRAAQPATGRMQLGFGDPGLHRGKVLLDAKGLNYEYEGRRLWRDGLSFTVTSGERLALRGGNGTGKTTLLRLLLGRLAPAGGTLFRAVDRAVYIDQDYSMLDDGKTVYIQAQSWNAAALPEHEVKSRLTHFLFTKNEWEKRCGALSGGERMRLALCCLTLAAAAPDLLVLDEPTNNLDLQNLGILTGAVAGYAGTLLLVSHDERFLEEAGVTRFLELD
ncbi:MAG: ABC-F family ATP-binding cassette domain-containing protein [Chitinophagaceae bacterium]|nr:MAG: ABC-F family ATP-binding cassette domain-containing protein [Chitinophagaceae bacterium]